MGHTLASAIIQGLKYQEIIKIKTMELDDFYKIALSLSANL